MTKRIYTIPQFKKIGGNTYSIAGVYQQKTDADKKAMANRNMGYKTKIVKIAREARYPTAIYHTTVFGAPSYAVYSDFAEW